MMTKFVALSLMLAASALAQVPDNLVVEGVPAHTPELRADVGRYLEFRAAAFTSWHPKERQLLISTRFADMHREWPRKRSMNCVVGD